MIRLKTTILTCTFIILGISGILAQSIVDTASIEARTTSLEERMASLEKVTDKLTNFKVSGYIQAQYQNGQSESLSLKVGDPLNEDSGEKNISRIGIRRGRIKFVYEENIYQGVFQLNITEKGVGVKDAYFQVKDPWFKSSYLRAGVFDRPFGYEISYSSSKRETPERSEVFQDLFPDERDLGFGITLQPANTSPLNFLKLESGMFAGNGIEIDSDNRKDFIGHLSASKSVGKHANWGLGFSYYRGSVFNPTEKLYRMNGQGFESEIVDVGSYAKREYFGFDGRFGFKTIAGTTQIRAEYLWGVQPSTSQSNKSPGYAARSAWTTQVTSQNGDGLYSRNFRGYYVYFIQGLLTSPLSLVFKYDRYDPNTKIAAGDVGVAGSNTSPADLSVWTFGLGGLWDFSKSFRLMAYYEINKNEVAVNAVLPSTILYNHELKDNVLTLRMQYKF